MSELIEDLRNITKNMQLTITIGAITLLVINTNSFHNIISLDKDFKRLSFVGDRITTHNARNKGHIQLLVSTQSNLDEIKAMKAKDIRKELESYGIGTKTFFEKKELVEALKKAREDGLKPIDNDANSETKAESDAESEKSDSQSSAQPKKESREEKLAAQIIEIKKMKVSEIKKELKELGISTRTYFEKSEFVKVLAEARVDGVKKKSNNAQVEEEVRDPSYRDVVMRKFNARDLPSSTSRSPIIDIRLT